MVSRSLCASNPVSHDHPHSCLCDHSPQEEQRELDLETSQIPYEDRDHAWFVAFGPYKNPRYSICVFVEHGGSGSKAAAPLAKQVIKKVIDRHEEREKIRRRNLVDI